MPTIVTDPFTVAAIGFNPALFELERNIAAAATMIEEAAGKGAKVIVLPELSMSGSDYPDLVRYHLTTKREAVDYALRALAGQPMTREEMLEFFGAFPDLEIPVDSPAPDAGR